MINCGGRIIVISDPLTAEEHNDLGVAYERNGEYELAETHYKKAIDMNPDKALFHFNLGNLLYRTGRKTEALGEFEKARELSPDSPDILNNLCQARLELSIRLENCEEEVRSFIESGNEVPWYLFETAGDLASISGDASGAFEYYEKAISTCQGCGDDILKKLSEKASIAERLSGKKEEE